MNNRSAMQYIIIPPDILKRIFSLLSIKCLGRIAQVSSKWHVYSSVDDVWASFAKDFNVESSNIKSNIESRLGLEQIYRMIKKKIWQKEESDFFCKFVKLLFEDNIRKISYVSDKKFWFILTLKKTRQIYFKNPHFKNIRIPKKVSFCIDFDGLEFQDCFDHLVRNPIEINCLPIRVSSCLCRKIWINPEGKLQASYNRENIIGKNQFNLISTTPELTKIFLDSVWLIRM